MKSKWKVLCAGLLCTVTLTVGAEGLYAQNVPEDMMKLAEATETTDAQEPAYVVMINFDKNGGSGSMSGMTATNDQTNVSLSPNGFTRKGYEFAGWSTTTNGGVEYEDGANAASLATEENNGQTITLYAQWKLTTPVIKKMSSRPSEITVKYQTNSQASGYEIMYSTGKKFPDNKKTTFTKKVTNKKTASAELLRVIPNKKYYVKMRSYKKTGGTIIYSDWSKVREHKVKNGKTLTNTLNKKSFRSVGMEADVTLDGSGTGYHAKMVMGGGASAVSFGIQYDKGAAAPYTGRSVALIENIASNNAGGQSYIRPGNRDLKRKKTYHLMMITDGKGKYDVYVDYKKIGSCKNTNMLNPEWFRIEAAGRLNGDKVNISFKNVKWGTMGWSSGIAGLGILGEDNSFQKVRSNPGVKYKFDKAANAIKFSGTIKNMRGDWDVDYERASGIIQFN